MKLLLTSSGITNRSIEKALQELLGKPFKEANVTFVPTAANVEKGDKTWLVMDMYNLLKLGFVSFDVIDISAVPKDIWLPSFENADLLVFGGGNEGYLLTWLEKTGLKRLLPKLLKTKVYMGISAGSMVTAENTCRQEIDRLYYEATGTPEGRKGLGLAAFEILPHVNSPSFPNVRLDYLTKLARKTPWIFYALDDSSAVKVDGATITVVSEGQWKKFN